MVSVLFLGRLFGVVYLFRVMIVLKCFGVRCSVCNDMVVFCEKLSSVIEGELFVVVLS